MRRTEDHPPLVVLGLDITNWSSRAQFAFCASGVFVCFLLYGVAQEHIMLTWKKGGVHLGWFLTMVQCAFYSGFTYLASTLGKNSAKSMYLPLNKDHDQEEKKAPWTAFALIGFLSVSTIGLSNTAIEYVSYPTQVAFKSSKPIPVMLAGVLILGKSYSWLEYVATICLCLGLVLFTTGDMEMNDIQDISFQPSVGVGLLCVALVVDGIIGNVQQKTFAQHHVSPADMIMKTKGVAALLALLICIVDGQLTVALDFSSRYPSSLIPVLAYSICGVIGESFVMAIIKRFGALAAVITTSVRKAFTMIISFFLFSRPWTSTYITAAFLVWSGVALHIWGDHLLRSNKKSVHIK